MGDIFPAVVSLAVIGAIICAVFASFHVVHAAFCKAPNAPFRRIVAINPLNAFLYPDQLTEAGLWHRKLALRFFLAFAVCAALIVVARFLAITVKV